MARKFKYNPGDRIGPHNILMLERTKQDKNGKWYGCFQCPQPECDNEFETYIHCVTSGDTTSCGCVYEKRKYHIGDKLGPYNIELIEITSTDSNKKRHGKFVCPYHEDKEHIFECAIDLVVSGKKKGCGCAESRKKYHPGDKIGPYQIKFLKRIRVNERSESFGLFVCPYHNNEEHIFEANLGSVSSGNTKSCGCLNSYYEKVLERLFIQEGIVFVSEKKFPDCLNPLTGYPLRFDFYLPDYNIVFEYNGKHHYEQIPGWENFDAIKSRDNTKKQYCINNNITLIEIPYWEREQIDADYVWNKIKGV